MVQKGQVFPLASQNGGETRWAYRYRTGGRGSRRVQRGGFATEQAAVEALERALERLRRERGLVETPTLAEFVDIYLSQHGGEPETVDKLRWLLAKSVRVFGDRRLSQLGSPEIAAWRMTIPTAKQEITSSPLTDSNRRPLLTMQPPGTDRRWLRGFRDAASCELLPWVASALLHKCSHGLLPRPTRCRGFAAGESSERVGTAEVELPDPFRGIPSLGEEPCPLVVEEAAPGESAPFRERQLGERLVLTVERLCGAARPLLVAVEEVDDEVALFVESRRRTCDRAPASRGSIGKIPW